MTSRRKWGVLTPELSQEIERHFRLTGDSLNVISEKFNIRPTKLSVNFGQTLRKLHDKKRMKMEDHFLFMQTEDEISSTIFSHEEKKRIEMSDFFENLCDGVSEPSKEKTKPFNWFVRSEIDPKIVGNS